jgi:DNA-binding GntR family transcriptional regulator
MITMKNVIRAQAYRSKMQIAYNFLKENIATAKMKPGEPIVIGAVAQELGMSYIPVREALQRLEGDGLIVTKPHCSPTVSEFRLEDLKEVLQVRAIIEAKATELALPNIASEKIAALERLIDGSFRELQRNNLAKVALLDREFHRLIYEETGNRFLWELIQDLWNRSDRMLGVFTLVPMRARESCEEHRQILSAIKRRDSRLAAELVAMQKMKALECLLKYAKNPPLVQAPSPATAEEEQG